MSSGVFGETFQKQTHSLSHPTKQTMSPSSTNSSSFGSWYDQQRAAENGGESGGGDGSSESMMSWFGIESTDTLPLFNNTEGYSFDGMKQAMEAQMPKKILGMGYQQRFKVFVALLFLSALFFALAFFVGIPMLALKPQKFALSFTCGSITFMASFGILSGPMEHLKSMFRAERMFFTTIYIGSMITTLYLTCTKGGLQGYTLVLIASGVQLVALLWYLISFLPGGSTGLSIVMRAMCTMLQPVFTACFKLQKMCMQSCLQYFTRS